MTPTRLRDLLSYDQATGHFTWLVKCGHRGQVGTIAGTFLEGYTRIGVDKKYYRAHRLAWFYMTGEWPLGEIDHKDGIGTNNSWENLREATRSQNNANRKYTKNRSGFKGVSPSTNGKWNAYIKQTYLGTFPTPEEASNAYFAAAESGFGDFARKA